MTSTAGPDFPQPILPHYSDIDTNDEWSTTSEASSPLASQSRPSAKHGTTPHPMAEAEQSRVFPTRRCRFCWADVEPTVEMPSTDVPFFLQFRPRIRYVDSDSDLGELIKPCLCKGTRRYVHEGCLHEMRLGMMRTRGANWQRHYHECDICHFKYRLERMWAARAIGNRINQLFLTLVILFLLAFVLGFVTDPVINYYLGPYAPGFDPNALTNNPVDIKIGFYNHQVDVKLSALQRSQWGQHIAKGLASVGALSFGTAILLSPWQWWSMRNALLQGNGRLATTSRDRITSLSLVVIFVGVLTALWKIYSFTHYLAARYLTHVSDRVKNIQLPDDDDDIQGVIQGSALVVALEGSEVE